MGDARWVLACGGEPVPLGCEPCERRFDLRYACTECGKTGLRTMGPFTLWVPVESWTKWTPKPMTRRRLSHHRRLPVMERLLKEIWEANLRHQRKQSVRDYVSVSLTP